jgi:hypothetical protein
MVGDRLAGIALPRADHRAFAREAGAGRELPTKWFTEGRESVAHRQSSMETVLRYLVPMMRQ